jgi:GNAT superfamily N-acetyltransferase
MKSIRQAGIEDVPIIRDLARMIWPEAYGTILSPEQLSYMLDRFYSIPSLEIQIKDYHHNFILVLKNNKPVGFASFSPKPPDMNIIRLHKIYILPQEQGNGTGKFLLQNVIEGAKLLGGRKLELNVNRNNKARIFYEKQGFFITGEEDIDIGNGYFMNDYIMELWL